MIIAVCLVVICLIVLSNFGKIREFLEHVKKLSTFPCKKGYPVIGNLLEFLGTPDVAFRAITMYINEYSRRGVTVMWMSSFLPYVLITEPDVIEKILRSQSNIKKGLLYNVLRPWLNDGLLTSTGKKWHSRRKILTPAFHFNILQKFLHIFNGGSRAMVDILRDHTDSVVDLPTFVSKFTLDTICETAMGTKLREKTEEGEKYRSAVHQFGNLAVERTYKTWLLIDSIFRLSKKYLQQIEVLDILHGFTKQVINMRKVAFLEEVKPKASFEDICYTNKRKMAMLDLLLFAQSGGEKIDDDGIREEVDTFVFEGHDTTAVSLSFTIMLLANNKHCQDKVYEELTTIFGDDVRDPTNVDLQEMKYLECCIKESLRLFPSVPKISRILGGDIIMEDGQIIPEGTLIIIAIYEMHRRSDLYSNPEKFIPERFLKENIVDKHPYAYLPFSAGPRNCIGQKFAMMEMKCLLSAILREYTLEPVDTPEDMKCIMDFVLRTKTPIRVKFIPRKK